jgi:hypothetical protein
MAATPAEGGSSYTEVILSLRGCEAEPCRLMIGVSRNASEGECRETVKRRLEEHLADSRFHSMR